MAKSKKPRSKKPKKTMGAFSILEGPPPPTPDAAKLVNLVPAGQVEVAISKLTNKVLSYTSQLLAHLMQTHGVPLSVVIDAMDAVAEGREPRIVYWSVAENLVEEQFFSAQGVAIMALGLDDDDLEPDDGPQPDCVMEPTDE